MRVAFIVQVFPQTSEVFIINQIADLSDRGIDVTVFCLEPGDGQNVSERYRKYEMHRKVRVLGRPRSVGEALSLAFGLLTRNPAAFLRALNLVRFGRKALTLQMVFEAAALSKEQFDVVHCHFGRMANYYLPIRKILGQTTPMLTSFYGYDVSNLPKIKGPTYYDALMRECHAYIVMSNDMKERVVALGFPAEEVTVLPVSIDVEAIPFEERALAEGERVELVTVGRFVEKKGMDDVLRAAAILKEQAKRPFHITLVGGGELEADLKRAAKDLDVEDVVTFAGYMKLEDIIPLFLKKHLYLQPSKTARNGDME